jgi:hypothetical protein
MRSVVRPPAEANLYAAARWYQDEEPGSTLWLDLLEEFESVVARVSEHPESAPVYEGAIRRALLRESKLSGPPCDDFHTRSTTWSSTTRSLSSRSSR